MLPALQGTQEGEQHLRSQGTSPSGKGRALAPGSDRHMKGMISASPDSCIFPHLENHKTP